MPPAIRSIVLALTVVILAGVAGPASAQSARRAGSPAARAGVEAKGGPMQKSPGDEAPVATSDPKSGVDAPPADPKSTEAEPAAGAEAKAKPKVATAIFGAGCFWSTEAVFERYKGVKSVVSGFSGGNVLNPSYQQVCTGQTGHAEVVQVEYDPAVISYEELLKIYFFSHDPTTPNAQGDDFGPQYRSVVFYRDEAQREAALKMYRDLTARKAYRAPIVTQLVPFETFYPAEPYHQDYFRNHRQEDYSATHIVPKLRKMSKLKLK